MLKDPYSRISPGGGPLLKQGICTVGVQRSEVVWPWSGQFRDLLISVISCI